MTADDKVDDRLIQFAHRLADASGAVIRPFFRQRIEVAHKPGKYLFDPVTESVDIVVTRPVTRRDAGV